MASNAKANMRSRHPPLLSSCIEKRTVVAMLEDFGKALFASLIQGLSGQSVSQCKGTAGLEAYFAHWPSHLKPLGHRMLVESRFAT